MTVTTKKLPDSVIRLTISLGKNDLLGYVAEAEEQLARQMKIDGFRFGKVPREKIRSKIGDDKIREEALKIAVQSSLKTALVKEKIDVIEQFDFKIKENSSQKLVYQVMLLVFPEFVLSNYKGLGIKKRAVAVSESEVKEVINELLNLKTVFEEVERPAQKGDRVEIDFTIKYNGKVIEGGRSENHPVVLGDGKFIPGFEEHLVGMKIGENKHFSLQVPSDFYQKTVAGKKLDFDVFIKKVENRILPELNDEFARSLGSFGSLRELETSIKEGLTMEKEMKERDRVRLLILREIASKTKIKVPRLLVERKLDEMISNFDSDLHQKGLEISLYLAQINKTQDELRQDWRSQAELQAKFGLITSAIARAENLRVNEKDVEKELEAVLERYLLSKEGGVEAFQDVNVSWLKDKIRNSLLNEKVLEFLERQNVVA